MIGEIFVLIIKIILSLWPIWLIFGAWYFLDMFRTNTL